MSLETQMAVLAGGAGGDAVTAGLVVFFALAIGHAVADFPLQGEFLARGKDRHRDPRDLMPPRSGSGALPRRLCLWPHCLTAHALVHAGAVWVVTGLPVLALAEFVLHWMLDFAKCEGWTGFHVDQILHLFCKAAYVFAVAAGWVAWSAVG